LEAESESKKVSKLRMDDGRTSTSQEDMFIVAQAYFEKLFATNAGVHEPVLNLMTQCVLMNDNIMLHHLLQKKNCAKPFFICNLKCPKVQMVLI